MDFSQECDIKKKFYVDNREGNVDGRVYGVGCARRVVSFDRVVYCNRHITSFTLNEYKSDLPWGELRDHLESIFFGQDRFLTLALTR